MISYNILVRRSVAPLDSGMQSALLPVAPGDDAALAKIPMGEVVAIGLARGRSLPMHRLFWGILDYVAKASEFETAENLLIEVKLKLGRYDVKKMPDGSEVRMLHSISFGKMPQDDFAKFFDDGLRYICAEVIPGTERDDLVREVEIMLGVTAQKDDTRKYTLEELREMRERGETETRADAPVHSLDSDFWDNASVVIPPSDTSAELKRKLGQPSFYVPVTPSSKGGAKATLDALLARARQIHSPEDFDQLCRESAKTIQYLRDSNLKLWNQWNTESGAIEQMVRDGIANEHKD